MAVKIELKRSSVPGKIPSTSQLDYGELAINTYDGIVYLKKSGSQGPEIVAIGGSGSASPAILSGSAFYAGIFAGSTILVTGSIYDSASFTAIGNNTPVDPTNPDRLFVDAGSTNSYNLISGHGDIDNYLQLNIQNFSYGALASSDVVATANIGSENDYYVNMGINNSGHSDPAGVGNALDAYLYSTGRDLLIGNSSAGQKVIIFNGPGQALDNARVFITAQGTVGINTSNTDLGNPEALLVEPLVSGSVTTADFSNLIIGKGTINESYLQLNIINKGTGSYASADIVATNNLGTETSNYVDMGINASTHIVDTTFAPGGANDTYLLSTGHDLLIGSATTGSVVLWTGPDFDTVANAKLILKTNNQHEVTGSLNFEGGASIVPSGPNIDFIAGPNGWSELASNDGNQYVWVDNNGTYLITNWNSSAHSWTFDLSGSLTAPGNITIPATSFLYGTASWALNTITSSYADTAVSASYALTASYALNGGGSSIDTGSFATTGSNTFYGNQIISGTTDYLLQLHGVNGGPWAFGLYNDTYNPTQSVFAGFVGDDGISYIGNEVNTPLYVYTNAQYNTPTLIISSSGVTVTGGGITGSLEGTASWAKNALTASYSDTTISASYASTASYWSGSTAYATTASVAISSSLAQSASYWSGSTAYASTASVAISSSYALSSSFALSASYWSGSTAYASTASVAISASYALSSSFARTASFWSGSTAYAQTSSVAISASYALSSSYALSASYWSGSTAYAATSSVSISSSLAQSASYWSGSTAYASTASVAISSSYALSSSYAQTASYVQNAISASYAATASSADFFLVRNNLTASNALINGTITAQTLVVQTVTSSVVYSSGSNIFGNQLTNTQQFTGSVTITGSLKVNGNSVITANQTSSMSVLSASYANTASYVNPLNQTVIISGSLNITGSNTVIGNTVLSGSIGISGSQTFTGTGYQIGTSYFTGSVNISGSTTQVGNNTLLGNTSLSGSLTISGALGAATPTINILGDVSQTGYSKYLPVVTNINSSLSGSYIYVSGSTQDLYFTQNGAGYANTTRLRWLEGNLYTGLLNGGLITTQSSTVYQVSSGSGIIVNLNASLNNNPYPVIQYLNWNNLSASIAPLSASYDQQFIGIQSNGTLYAQGTPLNDGQLDTIIQIGVVLHQNHSTINGVSTQPQVAYGLKQNESVFINAFGPLKLSGYTLATSGSSTGSLIVGNGTAYLNGGNYPVDPNNPSYITGTGANITRIFKYYDSGSDWVYDTNNGAGYGTIDPSQYSNNGTLSNVGAGNWSIQRCFFFPTSPLSPKPIVVYYGNAIYATEAEAIANIPFEPFIEAPNTAANAIYLGAIVISGNGTFTNSNTYKILAGGLFRQTGGSGGGGSTVTTTLAGLSDVSITSPTNLQPLAYNATALKWENVSIISSSIVGNASTATSASYASTASFLIGQDNSKIVAGAVTASVSTNPSSLFLVQSGSIPYFSISSSGDTTVYSSLFIVKDFVTKQPVLTVSQSVVQIATHSFDPNGTTTAGSIWFTSSSMYIGLEN